MSELIQISAKNIAPMVMPDFCPRCFWLKLHVKNLPYQIFPGIFSSIDAYSKSLIHHWFNQRQAPPPWLADLGELTGYINPPSWQRFKFVDESTNICLTGSADGIYLRPDGSHLIVDYKTAKFSEYQDRLYPLYETQLNIYALIAEHCQLSPVSGLALIYTEPLTDEGSFTDSQNHRHSGFALGFAVKVLNVPLDTSKINALLISTREIYDMPSCPTGRDKCKDCQTLDTLLHIAGQ